MQTFLPYLDYEQTAISLDNKRLNKQILEGYQILKILSGASESGAWRNHPAVLMWKNSEYYLNEYIKTIIKEADFRGIKTINNKNNIKTLRNQFKNAWGKKLPIWSHNNEVAMRLTTTHKANLFTKDPIHYASFKSSIDNVFNSPCCSGCKYYWVTHPLRDKS